MAQVSWMCFIISNDLYTAHHNLLGICHQLKICHLYGTFKFLTQLVWGLEACLSTVFVERRALYKGKPYCGSDLFLFLVLYFNHLYPYSPNELLIERCFITPPRCTRKGTTNPISKINSPFHTKHPKPLYALPINYPSDDPVFGMYDLIALMDALLQS